MTIRVGGYPRLLVAAACLAAATASGSFAHAQGEAEPPKEKPAAAPADGPVEPQPGTGASAAPAEHTAPAESGEHAQEHGEAHGEHGEHGEAHGEHGEAHGEHGDHGEEHEAEEKKWSVSLDAVIGFGKTDVVTQDLPGSLATVPTTTRGPAQINAESFIIGLGYEVAHHVGVGARLPFSFGTFSQPGRQTRGTSTLGNVELEAEYEYHLNKQMKLIYVLGISLPTAQGDELPEAEAAGKLGIGSDLNAYDRFAVNRAAAGSRGYEENALFEAKRFGIIPKVAFDAKFGKLTLQPYVKLENLISTISVPEHSYIGELILGVWAGYLVNPLFEPGIRAWTNIPIAGNDEGAVAVIEPQVRLHVGSITPIIGGIIPFAGPLTEPQFGGIRLAVAGRF